MFENFSDLRFAAKSLYTPSKRCSKLDLSEIFFEVKESFDVTFKEISPEKFNLFNIKQGREMF